MTVDQKPIGRTPRSNLATYTGLFDDVRKRFADTKAARSRNYDAGRFSFNVAKGRCETCQGEGFVFVELLFLPSVYAPCPTCHGARYNSKTLEIKLRGKSIADVLGMTVADAAEFFVEDPVLLRALQTLLQVGLGYLRLGNQRLNSRAAKHNVSSWPRNSSAQAKEILSTYWMSPTTGLHAADVEKLVAQLHGLVDAGNTVVVVEHEMQVVASSDWVIDMGPGAGDEGGQVVAAGTPDEVAVVKESRTAKYLAAYLKGS